jgi:hypothetical protein
MDLLPKKIVKKTEDIILIALIKVVRGARPEAVMFSIFNKRKD